MEWVITIVSVIIALASLIYTIIYNRKQRMIVEREISKKRYLESALSNLNGVIQSLKLIKIPCLCDLDSLLDSSFEDTYLDADTIVSEILKAGLETKKKKINLDVSYRLRELGKRGEENSKTTPRIIEKFNKLDLEWFFNLLHSDKVFLLESNIKIQDYERRISNELSFDGFIFIIYELIQAKEKLFKYEDVYESISSDCLDNLNQLIKEVAEEIFKTISKPKTIQIDLNEFSIIDELMRFLIEKILNYSVLAQKLSKISDILSELTKVRKELFLKIE